MARLLDLVKLELGSDLISRQIAQGQGRNVYV